MVLSFSLVDAASLGDLKVFLGRSARIGCDSVRLIGDSGVLAVYVAVIAPRGLLDSAPTVLGLRTFALTGDERLDVTVPTRALLDRLAALSLTAELGQGPLVVPLPPVDQPVAWAGVAPPRGGWRREGEVSVALLDAAARSGVDEVATALPESPGDAVAHRVRSEVWGRAIAELPIAVPAGAAFAAQSLGFLAHEDEGTLHSSGRWSRVTTRRGHVLARLSGGR